MVKREGSRTTLVYVQRLGKQQVGSVKTVAALVGLHAKCHLSRGIYFSQIHIRIVGIKIELHIFFCRKIERRGGCPRACRITVSELHILDVVARSRKGSCFTFFILHGKNADGIAVFPRGVEILVGSGAGLHSARPLPRKTYLETDGLRCVGVRGNGYIGILGAGYCCQQ